MLFASAMFWLCTIVSGDIEEADLSTVSTPPNPIIPPVIVRGLRKLLRHMGTSSSKIQSAVLNAEWLHPQSERGILLLIFGCISWALGTLYAKYRSSREEESSLP